MWTLRRWGGTWATSTPSSRISPAVGRSKPAIIRSVVVFPHPDGPSSEKNSPALIGVDRDPAFVKALGQVAQFDVAGHQLASIPDSSRNADPPDS